MFLFFSSNFPCVWVPLAPLPILTFVTTSYSDISFTPMTYQWPLCPTSLSDHAKHKYGTVTSVSLFQQQTPSAPWIWRWVTTSLTNIHNCTFYNVHLQHSVLNVKCVCFFVNIRILGLMEACWSYTRSMKESSSMKWKMCSTTKRVAKRRLSGRNKSESFLSAEVCKTKPVLQQTEMCELWVMWVTPANWMAYNTFW